MKPRREAVELVVGQLQQRVVRRRVDLSGIGFGLQRLGEAHEPLVVSGGLPELREQLVDPLVPLGCQRRDGAGEVLRVVIGHAGMMAEKRAGVPGVRRSQ